MRISTAETNHRDKISKRIPANLPTIEKLLAANRTEWDAMETARKEGREADATACAPALPADATTLQLSPKSSACAPAASSP